MCCHTQILSSEHKMRVGVFWAFWTCDFCLYFGNDPWIILFQPLLLSQSLISIGHSIQLHLSQLLKLSHSVCIFFILLAFPLEKCLSVVFKLKGHVQCTNKSVSGILSSVMGFLIPSLSAWLVLRAFSSSRFYPSVIASCLLFSNNLPYDFNFRALSKAISDVCFVSSHWFLCFLVDLVRHLLLKARHAVFLW